MAFTHALTKLHATTHRLKFILRGKHVNSGAFIPASTFNGSRRFGAMSSYDDAAKQGRDAANKGIDAAKKGSQQLKKEFVATAAADNAGEKVENVAGKVSETAQDAAKVTAVDAAGKVKETAQSAWGTVKGTAQNIKDTVVGKAEATAESANDAVKEANRTMKKY